MRPLALDLGLAVALVVALVAFGSGLYLLVTFAVMRAHTEPRTWRRVVRAFLHEVVAILVTQPLLPLFYVVGRRMGGTSDGRPVIFVHGYFQNRVDFVFLARAARKAKLGPIYGFNYDFRRSVSTSAKRLAGFVEEVRRETGKDKVAVVAHSLGGVVALEYLATPDGAARVDRCVTIASPHAGVRWRFGMFGGAARDLAANSVYMRSNEARQLPIRALSIYSSHDNMVHPPTTSVLTARGGDDRVIEGTGHLGMLFSKEVAEATVALLSE